jgi:hypothetical protein
LILPGKGCIGLHRVQANTQDLGVQRLKFADSITESSPLDNSARCVSLRVKPQHDRLLSIVA